MTICTPALPTKKIPLCILTLIIGKISSANANVNIFIVDITTGRRFILQSTSDGAGLVSVDLTAIEFSEEHTYELWITLQSANPEDKEDITIDTETATTVALGFLSLFTEGGYCFPADGTLETA